MNNLLLVFLVCSPGSYKAEVGDGSCLPCPEHSSGPDYGLAECRCNNGYYRAHTDPKNMSCTRKFSFYTIVVRF